MGGGLEGGGVFCAGEPQKKEKGMGQCGMVRSLGCVPVE